QVVLRYLETTRSDSTCLSDGGPAALPRQFAAHGCDSLSAVQSSAEAYLRPRLLQPPAARMDPPRRPVSPLGPARAKAAIASPARQTTARQSRHRPPIRSAAPSWQKNQ